MNKGYLMDYIVIDPQYGNVPKNIKNLILNLGRGQNTYKKYYPGDGYFKPLVDHEDPSKAIFYDESHKQKKYPYAYEIGEDPISDWLFSEGFKPTDKILFF